MAERLEKTFAAACVLLCMAVAFSCEKNEFIEWKDQDRMEVVVQEDGGRLLKVVSSIELPEQWPFDISRDSLFMTLQSVEDVAERTEFKILYRQEDGKLFYTIFFPIDMLPDDGEYILESVRDGQGKSHLRKMVIAMMGQRMVSAASADMSEEYKKIGGTGTAEDPLLLDNITDLTTLASLLKQDTYKAKGLYFKLGTDLDMEEYYKDPFRPMDQGWCGIGGGFAGILDGAGHKISNLYHSDSQAGDIGLFKYLLDGAQISNLVLDDVSIVSSKCNTGAVAGYTSGNVKLSGISVSGNIASNGDCVGGLVGKVADGRLEILECELGSGTVKGANWCGGFVGAAEGALAITESNNDNMTVEATASGAGGFVGGMIGGSAGNSIEYSDCDANVSAPRIVGGIAGQATDLAVDGVQVFAFRILAQEMYCGGLVGYSTGKLSVNNSGVAHSSSANYQENIVGSGTASSVGGLVGYSNSDDFTIVESDVQSPVTGKDKVGGFVGELQGSLKISGSLNSSSSQLKGESRVGGFVGYSAVGSLTIRDSEQRCAVVATGGYVGGVVGECAQISVDTLYLNGSVSGGDKYAGGIVGLGRNVSLDNIEFGSGVTVNGPADVGGIAGRLENSKMEANPFSADFAIIVCGDESYSSSAVSVGGICGSASDCEFRNITVKCSVYGKNYIGGLVGYNERGGVIDNCTYDGKEVAAAGDAAGGIVGYSVSGNAELKNLVNYGKVTAAWYTGGIVGKLVNDGASFCTNLGTVSGGEDTGGIVGCIDNDDNSEGGISVYYCTNSGTVTAGRRALGGIAGYVESGSNNSKSVTFSKCYNTGTVSGTGTGSGDRDAAGGIVGEGKYSLIIEYCANKGTVNATAGFHHIGGLVGYFGENSSGYDNYVYIKESYNSGTVEVTQSGANSTYVGGIAGHLEDSNTSSWNVHIKNCYNRGSVLARTSNETYHAGGIVGKASYYLAMEYCYSSGRVRSQEEGGSYYRAPGMAGCHADGETLFPDSRLNQLFIEEGTAWDDWNESLPVIIDWGSYFDAADKSDKGSYGSFDFNSIWDIKSDINGGYPYLRNNP
ncbi:MAG: hypothetical protein IJN06_07705 [Bacteroidales bacterium]|nr:hypothetical protein [Bacteroidales bacterium]